MYVKICSRHVTKRFAINCKIVKANQDHHAIEKIKGQIFLFLLNEVSLTKSFGEWGSVLSWTYWTKRKIEIMIPGHRFTVHFRIKSTDNHKKSHKDTLKGTDWGKRVELKSYNRNNLTIIIVRIWLIASILQYHTIHKLLTGYQIYLSMCTIFTLPLSTQTHLHLWHWKTFSPQLPQTPGLAGTEALQRGHCRVSADAVRLS